MSMPFPILSCSKIINKKWYKLGIFPHTLNMIETKERRIPMSIFHKKKPEKNEALLLELAKTKLELETAYSNFENVTDPDLIDCSIYEVNAIQQRYKYLLRQLKSDETDALLQL